MLINAYQAFRKRQILLYQILLISPTGNQLRFIIARLIYSSKAIYARPMNNKTNLITLCHADKFPFAAWHPIDRKSWK